MLRSIRGVVPFPQLHERHRGTCGLLVTLVRLACLPCSNFALRYRGTNQFFERRPMQSTEQIARRGRKTELSLVGSALPPWTSSYCRPAHAPTLR